MNTPRLLRSPSGLLPVAAGLFFTVSESAVAQYSLSWSSIDGGAHRALAGGNYSLSGTAGQPDAVLAAGGDFTLAGGFEGMALRGPVRLRIESAPAGTTLRWPVSSLLYTPEESSSLAPGSWSPLPVLWDVVAGDFVIRLSGPLPTRRFYRLAL